MKSSLDAALHRLQESARPILGAQQELAGEIALLFRTAVVDRSMTVGRARRLLEVLVVDYYIRQKCLQPPFRNQIKTLYNLIEELGANQWLSQSAVSLCHAVRIEGNRVLHYSPDRLDAPKWPEIADGVLLSTLVKLLEIAEAFGNGGCSLYSSMLEKPFGALYDRLLRDWKPVLAGKQVEQFPLFEALELLFRSVVAAMRPEWLALLEKYASDHVLADELPTDEEHGLRQLRNLGLIHHDGPWLFTPTRSGAIWPSPAGTMLAALSGPAPSLNPEPVAREVVRRVKQASEDGAAIELLDRVSDGHNLEPQDKTLARKLRNLYLLTHDTYFLEQADRLMLTDLGYYVLGKCSPD